MKNYTAEQYIKLPHIIIAALSRIHTPFGSSRMPSYLVEIAFAKQIINIPKIIAYKLFLILNFCNQEDCKSLQEEIKASFRIESNDSNIILCALQN